MWSRKKILHVCGKIIKLGNKFVVTLKKILLMILATLKRRRIPNILCKSAAFQIIHCKRKHLNLVKTLNFYYTRNYEKWMVQSLYEQFLKYSRNLKGILFFNYIVSVSNSRCWIIRFHFFNGGFGSLCFLKIHFYWLTFKQNVVQTHYHSFFSLIMK